ncbi:28616_t:CDS:2, partial [Gigaspora margarita]
MAQIALIINILMTLISGFGIIAACAESVRLLKTFSVLFIFLMVFHIMYAIYYTVNIYYKGYLSVFTDETMINFVGPIIEVYFAKILVDYTEIVKIARDNTSTPGRVETSSVTNNQ